VRQGDFFHFIFAIATTLTNPSEELRYPRGSSNRLYHAGGNMNQRQANELAATILHEIHITSSLQQFFGSEPNIRIEPSTREADTDELTESSTFFVKVISNGNKLAATAYNPNNYISSRSFSAPSEWEKFRQEITLAEGERVLPLHLSSLQMIDDLSALDKETKQMLKTQVVRHQFLLASLSAGDKRLAIFLGFFLSYVYLVA
jgi:hypothetical protein